MYQRVIPRQLLLKPTRTHLNLGDGQSGGGVRSVSAKSIGPLDAFEEIFTDSASGIPMLEEFPSGEPEESLKFPDKSDSIKVSFIAVGFM